ncbi:MAG: nitroreductase family protein [Devosia sp.]|nr:nitroreductase family protein [Devosia sp.]
MQDLLDLIHQRHSARTPFDSRRPVPQQALDQILEAASWAPTAHNMQNFEILVVDDPARLKAIGTVETRTSPVFLRENARQLSFSLEELRQRGTGVIATMFPAAWRDPDADFDVFAAAEPPAPLSHSLQAAPCLLLVLYDARKRAPASGGDVLGFISLGCVMENMWLTAQSLGLGLQILSVFSSRQVEAALRRMLDFPAHLKIAYACRLGFPAEALDYVRVRRPLGAFVHRNRYGSEGPI